MICSDKLQFHNSGFFILPNPAPHSRGWPGSAGLTGPGFSLGSLQSIPVIQICDRQKGKMQSVYRASVKFIFPYNGSVDLKIGLQTIKIG